MFSKFKKGKGESNQAARARSKQEAAEEEEEEEEKEEEDDEAITRSKSYTQQVSKYRRRSNQVKQVFKKG